MTETTRTASRKPARHAGAAAKRSDRFTPEERAAMRERNRELKAARTGQADGESDLLAKIAEMAPADRAMAERVHAIVKAAAPELTSRTWYGMPAYAKNGKVVCFFRDARKFKERYATLGFSDNANLDDGTIWPTAYAITEMSDAGEARISALVKQATTEH